MGGIKQEFCVLSSYILVLAAGYVELGIFILLFSKMSIELVIIAYWVLSIFMLI